MILTPSEVRGSVQTSATDDALAVQIAGAEAELERVLGPVGEVREIKAGGGRVIILDRPAASVRRVREYLADADLTTADWTLGSDGRSLWRVDAGYRATWGVGPTEIAYQPRDDIALRRLVALQLIKHNVATVPGVLGFTEGNFSIQFPNGESWAATHEEILGTAGGHWSFA